MMTANTLNAQGTQVGGEARQRNATAGQLDTELPDTITFLSDGLTLAGAVRTRSEVVVCTREIIKQATDRAGDCFLSLDADQQTARWGRPMFAQGDCSAALQEEDEDARANAIQAVKFKADRDGMRALRDAWAEERTASELSKVHRWKSHSSRAG